MQIVRLSLNVIQNVVLNQKKAWKIELPNLDSLRNQKLFQITGELHIQMELHFFANHHATSFGYGIPFQPKSVRLILPFNFKTCFDIAPRVFHRSTVFNFQSYSLGNCEWSSRL